MNQIAENIKQRLSLREPLCDALDIVAQVEDTLSLAKPPTDNLKEFLDKELAEIQASFPLCTDFERDFPSVAFSIATGIGKTRLMGACIAYLYLKKGIRHFFILAPNLTIYEKLILDFGDRKYSKYVFNGISEFVHNTPIIITGENYEQSRGLFSDTEIQINIFNISKFNTDSKESKKGAPKMKRLSEYLGQSYFEYLSSLDDLVILMDEAHRYHADASKKAINELRPILGLELTATPIDEKGKSFKNIIFEYNLAQALADGKYVKNPCVGARKNFEKGNQTDEELDILKLEDAMAVHEKAKIDLELYSLDNAVPLVKPFVLVVCKNTEHAHQTVDLIENRLFDGRYKGKVIQMDSTTKAEMSDDEIRQFLEIERADNPIEIVVHVNMLKEGWDVTNLYTIVPLRAANAITLIEQTIGRGLRLPYGGKRTGNAEVDKLTVIAHENFNKILDHAKDPNSIFSKYTYITIDESTKYEPAVIVTPNTPIEKRFEQEQKRIANIPSEPQRETEQAVLEAQKVVYEILPTLGTSLPNKSELTTPKSIELIKEKATAKVIDNLRGTLFAEADAKVIIEKLDEVIKPLTIDFQHNLIEIPRVIIEQSQTEISYNRFDLDTTKGFTLPELEQTLIRVGIVDQTVETITVKSSNCYKDPIEQIILALMDVESIDYARCSELLYHITSQAVEAIKSNLKDTKNVAQVVHQYKSFIVQRIVEQIEKNITLTVKSSKEPKVYPFSEIIKTHLQAIDGYGYVNYKETITPLSNVKKYIFIGFAKSYMEQCKFDSSTEQDLAYVLENNSTEVLRWLRPASRQFTIYWDGSKMYEPDFIVETKDEIFMLETKAKKDIEDNDVLLKKKAAEEYCQIVSAYTAKNGGKPWRYVIIAHDCVQRTHTFDYIIAKSN